LFQPVDSHPLLQRVFTYPQPHPLAAGAAEKNKEQQDDDPPHVVAVKEIAKAAHNIPPRDRFGLVGLCVGVMRCCSARSFTILCGASKTVTKIFPFCFAHEALSSQTY